MTRITNIPQAATYLAGARTPPVTAGGGLAGWMLGWADERTGGRLERELRNTADRLFRRNKSDCP
jgi:hypothetical protein